MGTYDRGQYKVQITETAVYEFIVEANGEEEAKDMAANIFVQAEDVNLYFFFVEDRSATSVTLIKEIANGKVS